MEAANFFLAGALVSAAGAGYFCLRAPMAHAYGSLLAAFALFISGCGASGSPDSTQQGAQPTDMGGTVSLRVWGAEEDAALLAQISSQFQAQ